MSSTPWDAPREDNRDGLAWATVSSTWIDTRTLRVTTMRPVPGGWLYADLYYLDQRAVTCSVTFVPQEQRFPTVLAVVTAVVVAAGAVWCCLGGGL